MSTDPFRLTGLAHGGGCGCKLAPSVLQELLAGSGVGALYPQLLVGNEGADDAAVWQLDDGTCVIATTDFFMPMVDDAALFGRIAATNAISDIYAMGGKPILALAILGMPVGKIEPSMVRQILAGGAAICAEAGIPIAGGHSIDCPEPVYGLAVIGTCRPEQLRRNSGARAGDTLILTKALGVGLYSAAFKKNKLSDAGYAELAASTTLLNRIGATLGDEPAVHAMTDVTGFGILGHGLEMARGSGVRLSLDFAALPLLAEAASLSGQGIVTGASGRNWDSYSTEVTLGDQLPAWAKNVLTDPQTSGGLLLSVAPERAQALCAEIVAAGYPAARVIGSVGAGSGIAVA